LDAKRIVHVIDNLSLGGAEILLLSTIKKLPGYEHHIITLTPEIHFAEIEKYGSLHCVHHTGWTNLLRTCRRIKNLVRQLNPAVIHSHLFLSSFLSRLALNHRYNFVYSIHNLYSATIFKNPRLRLMEKWIYHPSRKLITVSAYVLNDYKNVVRKCKTGNVLYNFIDDSFLRPLVAKTSKDFPANWVAVGSFKEQKNYEAVIGCIELLHQTYPERKISLHIYGDGPLRTALEKRIAGLPYIALKGRADNVSEILDEYDAYISASKYEGYGIAPMEALARGLPLFLSDIPVHREIYNDHAFFFSLRDNTFVKFVNAVEQYMAQGTSGKDKKRTEGYEYATKTAGSENYIAQLLAIYQINTANNPV